MRVSHLLILVLLAGAGIGCSTEEKPSYAELVVTYNAEAETLERLERKRARMVADYEATLRSGSDEALEALSGVLGSLRQEGEGPRLEATDPNELLDQAVASAEQMQQQTGALLEAAEKSGSQADGRPSMESQYSEEFKQELAKVDAEIEAQRARVDKARAARDAAEAE